MSDILARLSTWFRGGESRESGGGCRAGYGLVVSFVTMLVFCVLVATVSVWKAFVFAALAFAAFGIGECLAPESWRVGRRRGGAGAERDATAGAPQAAPPCRFGLSKDGIDALPAFAYESRGAEGGRGDVDVESAGSDDQLCLVCLEDLQAGEMVRQLPACKHLFHVECIDMWLHSHRTCPICRCDLSPRRKIAAKVAAVETEPPAVDALPPV